MLREDYLLRIIRQAAQAIAHILGLTVEQRYAQALEAIDHTLQEFLGLSSELLARLPESTLLEMMSVGGVADAGRILFLAEMLAMQGDIYAAQGDEAEARRRRLKSLNLYLEVARLSEPSALADQLARIEGLAGALRPSGLPPETLAGLFHCLEATGRYAKAEDALFGLIEASPRPAAAIEEGVAFYERLRTRSDAELVAGDLPRSEVEESLAELAGMQRRSRP